MQLSRVLLPTPGFADQGDDLAGRNGKPQPAEYRPRGIRVAFRQRGDVQHGFNAACRIGFPSWGRLQSAIGRLKPAHRKS
jgi:hypothetical protein